MKIQSFLDVDVVAVESADQVDVLLELQAPQLTGEQEAPPRTVVVCLDRSGSMGGEPLLACQRAITLLVRRLRPQDVFGLVAFDDTAEVVVPASPLADVGTPRVLAAVAGVRPGGSTDLGAGYVLALREAKRACGQAGASVLLLSDGHANAGLTDPGSVEQLARGRADRGVRTSAIGLGLGYDEELLAAAARGGDGDHVFAESTDEAVAAVAGQVEGLLETSVVAAALVVTGVGDRLAGIQVANDLPVTRIGDEVHVALGSMVSGEERRVLLRLAVPELGDLGLAQVAAIELRYTELPALVEHTVTLPVTVNVVPADVAAGRVPAPVVVAERLLQDAQSAKLRASRALRVGDVEGAEEIVGSARSALVAGATTLPPDARADVEGEIDELNRLADQVRESGFDTRRSAKTAMSSYSSTSRGRRPRKTL